MLTTEQPWTATRNPAAYKLRLHGGTEDERLIAIPPGKHSVGSGPRCQIRLDAAGVAAMECLLVRDAAGLRVRRWSDKTLVNGQPLEEANLVAGDLLTVGPVEIEIVGPEAGECASEGDEDARESWETPSALNSACNAIDDIFLIEEGSSQSRQPTTTNRDWHEPRPTERLKRTTNSATNGQATNAKAAIPVTKATVRRRSRRALDVLRRQRQDHDELLARVGDLERMLGEALAESRASQPAAEVTPSDHPHDEAAQAHAEIAQRVKELEGEVGSLHLQLGARDGELQQARYAIDVLERQLIDSQHTMHAFADERVDWERQFNDIESRLGRYIERIQELEQQLETNQATAGTDSTPTEEAQPVCESTATNDSATTEEPGINWEAEAALAEAANEPAAEMESADAAVATAVEAPPEEWRGEELDWQETIEEPATEVTESDVETAVEPESQFLVEATEESATPTEESAHETEQVDEALDHLRGLSIWRDQPTANDAPADAPTSSPATAESGASNEPVSFLDRYAHMFPEDDKSTPVDNATANEPPLTEAVPPPEVHTDEESVEQYMAKLLTRMRGGPSGGTTTPTPADQPNECVESNTASTVSETFAEKPEQPMFTNLEEMKSKTAPEQPSDLAAMRALANQSARHAISLHAARGLRRTAITRVIVTALGASVSVYLLLNSSTWRSLSFAAGCAAGFAALYWALLTTGTLLKGFQLGAFDDFEEEVTPEKSLNPPLPIDVEQTPADVEAAETSEQPATTE